MRQDARVYPTATNSGTCPTASYTGPSPMTMNSGDSSRQWTGAFEGCDTPKTSASGANYAWSWGSRKHLGCVCLSAGGDSLTDVPLPEARPDGSVDEEWASHRIAEEAMVVGFGLRSGSCLVRFLCSNRLMSGYDYYTRCEVFGSLKVYFIYMFCIGFILLVLLYS